MDKRATVPAPQHDYLVCIDSDGCAFDTMEIKHKECFCPAVVNVWDLQNGNPLFSWFNASAEHIALNSNGTKIERLYRLVGGKAEAIEFIARKGDSYIGIPLKDLNLKKGALVSIIVHQGKIIVPFGNDHIEENDHVVIISVESGISDLNEVLYK